MDALAEVLFKNVGDNKKALKKRAIERNEVFLEDQRGIHLRTFFLSVRFPNRTLVLRM